MMSGPSSNVPSVQQRFGHRKDLLVLYSVRFQLLDEA
jgi:hypothetical protein